MATRSTAALSRALTAFVFGGVLLWTLAASAPARACTSVPTIAPVSDLAEDGVLWIVGVGADRRDGLVLEGPSGERVALEVVETVGAFAALRPAAPVQAGLAYVLDAPGDVVDGASVQVTPATGPLGPPAAPTVEASFLQSDAIDSCLGGPSTYVCAADAAGALLETRVVEDATGRVLHVGVARGSRQLWIPQVDPSEVSVEVRAIGPDGQRSPAWTAPLSSLVGYRVREGAPFPPSLELECRGGAIFAEDQQAHEHPELAVLGGCSAAGRGRAPAGPAAWCLVALLGAVCALRRPGGRRRGR